MVDDLILVQWSCDVPLEKLENFLEFVEKKMKPCYESYGCKRYELFIPLDVKKQYFSFQVTSKRNRYIEQLVFNDVEAFEKFLETMEKDLHAKELTESYRKKFNVSSCSFTILTQKV